MKHPQRSFSKWNSLTKTLKTLIMLKALNILFTNETKNNVIVNIELTEMFLKTQYRKVQCNYSVCGKVFSEKTDFQLCILKTFAHT